MKHTKTDPACVYYKDAGPFRHYLNERGRGRACLVCVPLFKASPLDADAPGWLHTASKLGAIK